jgi:hypothetical protein
MSKCSVIDTFPSFLALWAESRHRPLNAQIEAWSAEYMVQWPELLDNTDYANSSSSALASCRSGVSNPSVNQP